MFCQQTSVLSEIPTLHTGKYQLYFELVWVFYIRHFRLINTGINYLTGSPNINLSLVQVPSEHLINPETPHLYEVHAFSDLSSTDVILHSARSDSTQA